MRKRYSNIFRTVAAALLLTSCNGSDRLPADRHEISFGVSLQAVTDDTKALLNPEDLYADGTKLKVYGFAKDASTGTAKDIGTGTDKLNSGQFITWSGSAWPFDNGATYTWATKTDYRFFGWLDTDVSATGMSYSAFFDEAPSFNTATGVLTVPGKEMGISEGNFDFAYSNVISRTAAQASFSEIGLQLQHLFASFSLAARNYTRETVYIENVSIHGLKDEKGASITFGESATTVSYGTGTSGTADLTTAQVVLDPAGNAGEAMANIVNGATNTPKYFLVWPQTLADLTPTTPYTPDSWSPADTEPFIEIEYRQGSPSAAPMTVKVPIPHDENEGWGAGVRRNMVLSFSEKKIELTVTPGDWGKQEPFIDYNGTATVTQALRVADGFTDNCIQSGTNLYFKSGMPIVLEFTIDQPANSTWIISKDGDFDAFEIDNVTDYSASAGNIGDGSDSAEGVIDSQKARIAIIPKIKEMQKNEYSLQLSFSVRRNNGDMMNINDRIYDENSPRTFVLLKY